MLGTPHHGTLAARLLPHPLVRQLRPGSEVLAELDAPALCSTRFLVFYSDLDQLIVPARNARLIHPDLDVTNSVVHGVGHLWLPVNGRVVHQICTALARVNAPETTAERVIVAPIRVSPATLNG